MIRKVNSGLRGFLFHPARWRSWAWPWEMRQRGVLGINRRDAEYVLPGNPRRYRPQVDDKLRTKRICQNQGIPVPQTLAVVEHIQDTQRVVSQLEQWPDFVVKPCQGSRGRGIIVITQSDGEELMTAGGGVISRAAFRRYLSAILAGRFSLSGRNDRAIIEQRVVPHGDLFRVAACGTPDVRIVLCRCVPVMAMVRFPTRASQGRANLHQGAVGAGVDLATGETYGGVFRNRAIAGHPDTGASLSGLQLPGWGDLLSAAVSLSRALQIGYVGIDFVIDARRGPVVLEANARPGLSLQIACRAGLIHRLKQIDGTLALRATVPPGCREARVVT